MHHSICFECLYHKKLHWSALRRPATTSQCPRGKGAGVPPVVPLNLLKGGAGGLRGFAPSSVRLWKTWLAELFFFFFVYFSIFVDFLMWILLWCFALSPTPARDILIIHLGFLKINKKMNNLSRFSDVNLDKNALNIISIEHVNYICI